MMRYVYSTTNHRSGENRQMPTHNGTAYTLRKAAEPRTNGYGTTEPEQKKDG